MATILGFQTKCKLCGVLIKGYTKAEVTKKFHHHIDNECRVAQKMKEWEKEGVYNEMMTMLSQSALIDSLEKLVKKYSLEKVKEALETIELGQE